MAEARRASICMVPYQFTISAILAPIGGKRELDNP
jgi:hypothetical protein